MALPVTASAAVSPEAVYGCPNWSTTLPLSVAVPPTTAVTLSAVTVVAAVVAYVVVIGVPDDAVPLLATTV